MLQKKQNYLSHVNYILPAFVIAHSTPVWTELRTEYNSAFLSEYMEVNQFTTPIEEHYITR